MGAEHDISVANMNASLISHLGSSCYAQDWCRRPSDLFWPMVKVSRQWDKSHHLGKPRGCPCPLWTWRGARHCIEWAAPVGGRPSRDRSHERVGLRGLFCIQGQEMSWGGLTNIGQFDGSTKAVGVSSLYIVSC